MDIVILGFGYFLIKFDCDEDRERVILDGPWTVQGHYLTIRPWTPNFYPSAATEESTMAWVRFPQLNLMYYDEDVLYAIASSIGKSIKIYVNTSLVTRGHFARVCVEVDLTKPLIAQFWLDGCWHAVEYEGFHVICFSCGKYGHLAEKCPDKPPLAAENQPQISAENQLNQTVSNQTAHQTTDKHASTSTNPGQTTKSNLPNPRKEPATNAFGRGPGMIAPKPNKRNNIEPRETARVQQKDEPNRFTLLNTEDLGDVMKERQVFSNSHNETANGRLKGNRNDTKKQKVEKGMRSVNIGSVVPRSTQEPSNKQHTKNQTNQI